MGKDRKEAKEDVLREIWLITRKLEALEEIIKDLFEGDDENDEAQSI